MNQDSRTLLSLVAAGRMTSVEAERWLAASREEHLASNEDHWILAALAIAALVQFWPIVTTVSQWTAAYLPQVLTHLEHALSLFAAQI